MAFFKFRKSGDQPSATQLPPESIEGMRKRAKHRLIGAAVLVLIGVVGFPLLFDKQQRPISVDTPIEIPDKNKAKPLNIPAPAATDEAKVEAAAPVASVVPVVVATEAPKIESKELAAPVQQAQAAIKSIASLEVKAVEKPVEKPVEKTVPPAKPDVKVDEGAKALALLEGKPVVKKADATEGRFVVQVGAFADTARAQEVRHKVERTGLKTYTHVAQTKDGARIRVRVGPFTTRAEAEKAAEKIKKLALPAAILTL